MIQIPDFPTKPHILIGLPSELLGIIAEFPADATMLQLTYVGPLDASHPDLMLARRIKWVEQADLNAQFDGVQAGARRILGLVPEKSVQPVLPIM